MTRLLTMRPVASPRADDNSAFVRRRMALRFFAGFAAGFIALSAAAYWLMETFELRFCQPFHNEILFHKVEYLRKAVRDPEIVYLGNSQMAYGVMPAVVSNELSRSGAGSGEGYNLAVPGTGLETCWLLARDVLTGHRRPKTLVLGVCPFMLAVEHTERDCQYWRYGTLKDVVEYIEADPACPPSTLATGVFRGLSNLVEFSLSRSRKPSLETRPEHLRQGQGGYWLPEQAATNHIVPKATWQLILRKTSPARFTFRDDGRQALVLRRFRDLAREHGMTLVLVYPPQHPAFCGRLYAGDGETRFDAWITSLCQREGICYHDLRDPARYVHEDFEDPVHLNARGAARFSRDLAAVLRTAYPSVRETAHVVP